jgi:signal peptidase
VKVGDVVVYNGVWFPDPIIHRVINIIKVNGTKIFTIKGDHNLSRILSLLNQNKLFQDL